MYEHSTPDSDGDQDIPWADEGPTHVDTRTREQQVYGMLTRVRTDLQQAALHLYRDYTVRGITPKEAADSLGVSEKFLGALMEFGMGRLADVLWDVIEGYKSDVADGNKKIHEHRQRMEQLEAGDHETILYLIERVL